MPSLTRDFISAISAGVAARSRGFFAHDELTHGAVSHQRGDIDAEFFLQPIKIFGEAGPFPFDRLAQHLRGHRFDPHEAANDIVSVFGAARGERQAAVAWNQGRHAVETRGCCQRVPQELGVHMRVKIDKAGRHCQACGVDGAPRALIDPPDLDDSIAVDRDIAEIGRQAAAVINSPAFDHDIVSHGASCDCEIVKLSRSI